MTWYANGQIRQKGEYNHGERKGAWLSWSENGQYQVGHQEPPSAILTGMNYRMLRIEDGQLTVGTRAQKYSFDLDHTDHTVTITRPYLMGATEVTQGMWRTVMGVNPTETRCPGGGIGDDLPVACVSFVEVTEFTNQLSSQAGFSPVYTIEGSEVSWNQAADGYRLPTGAEWENAASAGTHTRFSGTSELDEICLFANIDSYGLEGEGRGKRRWSRGECLWGDGLVERPFMCEDKNPGLAGVASFRPNRWGLYDMSGNVSEWVWDRTETYDQEEVVDPTGPDTAEKMAFGRAYGGTARIHRGGGWDSCPRRTETHFRSLCPAGTWYCKGPRPLAVGFRLARNVL